MRFGDYISSFTKPELENIIADANFTEDEIVIFNLLAKKCSITEIAINVSVCERTINRRIKHIKRKVEKVGGKNGKSNS